MEQTVQKLLQEVQGQVAELEKQKKAFAAEMEQKKLEFEQYKQREEASLQKKIHDNYAAKEEELIQREQKILEQENFVADLKLKNSKIIKLNVGGQHFTTSLTTLTHESDSMLAAMFSGRYSLEKDESGSVFIDRDGKYFSYILHYLRTNELSAEITEHKTLLQLQKEAQYYQLSGLMKLITEFKSKDATKHDDMVKVYIKNSSEKQYCEWPSLPATTTIGNLVLEAYRTLGDNFKVCKDGNIVSKNSSIDEFRNSYIVVVNVYGQETSNIRLI